MARPAREGRLVEPPAPAPAPPAACGGGGGGSLLTPPSAGWGSVPRGDPRPPSPPRHPRWSCACPGVPPPPPNFILYRCGTRGPRPPPPAHGHPTDPGAPAGPPQGLRSRGGGFVSNGDPPGDPPPALGPEQELGARLRQLGDAFQRTYEQQGGRGARVWEQLSRLLGRWMGVGDPPRH